MKFRLSILFVSLGILVHSQNISSAFQRSTTEVPIGFVKYKNFSSIYSIIKSFTPAGNLTDGGFHHHIGINNDGTIKFDSLRPISSGDFNARVFPTFDKGMFAIYYESNCSGQTWYYNPALFSIDSMGKQIFKKQGPLAAEQLSKTCFIYATSSNIYRFDPMTGIPTSTVLNVPSGIGLMVKDPKGHLIFTTSNSICVIDTNGNMLASTNNTVSFSKVKPYKNNYFFMKYNMIQRFDSSLNIVGTYSVQDRRFFDFSVYNDTIVIAASKLFNTDSVFFFSSNINNLNSPIQTTLNIVGHLPFAIQRDSVYTILANESRTTLQQACNGLFPHSSTSFYKTANLNNISFPQDIVLKRLKTQSFVFTGNNFSVVDYQYQNSLIVFNNSSDTVKFFHVSHPINYYSPGGSSGCGYLCRFVHAYDQDVFTPIPPMDSIEVSTPIMNGSSYTQFSPSISVCYEVSVPNHSAENNIKNSSSCTTFTFAVGLNEYSKTNDSFFIYPNPVSDILNLSEKDSVKYSVFDVVGKLILNGDAKKINVGGLVAGIYFITLENSNYRTTKKFVKE
jgi:hypothetical protein